MWRAGHAAGLVVRSGRRRLWVDDHMGIAGRDRTEVDALRSSCVELICLCGGQRRGRLHHRVVDGVPHLPASHVLEILRSSNCVARLSHAVGADIGDFHGYRECAVLRQAELVAGEVETGHIRSADDWVAGVTACVAHARGRGVRRLVGQPADRCPEETSPAVLLRDRHHRRPGMVR